MKRYLAQKHTHKYVPNVFSFAVLHNAHTSKGTMITKRCWIYLLMKTSSGSPKRIEQLGET